MEMSDSIKRGKYCEAASRAESPGAESLVSFEFTLLYSIRYFRN